MCLLTYYPTGIQPDTEALHNGATWNVDGHGYAIVAGSELIIAHDMRAEVLIERFAKDRAQHPDGPALFHSRWGTAGVRDERNCHPFRVGKDRRTVVAHNGVFPQAVQPTIGDKRCDTRVFAEDLLSGLNLGDAGLRARLGEWMGSGNKVAILTVNPRYPSNAYLINAHAGHWVGDIWYSNTGYLDSMYATTSAVAATATRAPLDWYGECWVCGSDLDVDPDRVMCLACNICLDCGLDWDNACECYLLPDGRDERYLIDELYSGPARRDDDRGPDDIPAELELADADTSDDDTAAIIAAAAERWARTH